MRQILKIGELDASSEDDVFHAAVTWANRDSINRRKQLVELINSICSVAVSGSCWKKKFVALLLVLKMIV